MRAMARISPARMAHVVGARLQQFIVIRLMSTSMLDSEVEAAVCTLSSAFQVSASRAAEVMHSRSRLFANCVKRARQHGACCWPDCKFPPRPARDYSVSLGAACLQANEAAHLVDRNLFHCDAINSVSLHRIRCMLCRLSCASMLRDGNRGDRMAPACRSPSKQTRDAPSGRL